MSFATLEALLEVLEGSEDLVPSVCTIETFSYDGKSVNDFKVFVKHGTGGSNATDAVIKVEALCLEHLKNAAGKCCEELLHVPDVITTGMRPNMNSFIILEYLDFITGTMKKGMNANMARNLGKSLALIHKKTGDINEYRFFGFPLNGQCGAFPQLNNVDQKDLSWADFWREFRLRPQMQGIKENYPGQKDLIKLLHKLDDHLDEFLPPSMPVRKSLLHGDLWSGNWGVIALKSGKDNKVTVFDPASYYGHHEADLGIADMFGMPAEFYQGYFEVFPKEKLPTGYAARRQIYELHHHLNHTNIFGLGYSFGAVELLKSILTNVRKHK